MTVILLCFYSPVLLEIEYILRKILLFIIVITLSRTCGASLCARTWRRKFPQNSSRGSSLHQQHHVLILRSIAAPWRWLEHFPPAWFAFSEAIPLTCSLLEPPCLREVATSVELTRPLPRMRRPTPAARPQYSSTCSVCPPAQPT